MRIGLILSFSRHYYVPFHAAPAATPFLGMSDSAQYPNEQGVNIELMRKLNGGELKQNSQGHGRASHRPVQRGCPLPAVLPALGEASRLNSTDRT